MTVKCSALAKSGKQCRRPALADKTFCLMHDPESLELRREAGRRGGQNRSNRARAQKKLRAYGAEDIGVLLSATLKDLLDGTLEPNVAVAATTVARGILTAAERGEVERLLSELESIHRERDKEGGH
jgi:hypothetical protein